ncbi:hypothetical protein G7051_01205 [Dysgonomonas sp. HDW5B]|uniref:beta strand repeat-containing protein n=1 Tax=Dysgonomonas sp. HDW5B TaxID=2714927 RepID=UPI00140DFA9D|nr:hypothetical protein [Dysgonomonas sp. HDW5B]QIK53038.1 hypothetical protein G7051_01205 [Dysgonomonas sp. HDW5B]
MKKFFLTAMSLWTIGSIYAQVGVNTETPATTLHVLPGKTDGTTAEGIIAPNLKRSEVIAKDGKYATAQTGAMVYVSDLSGVLTTKTAKIITTGYYYFDGALWQPFTSGSASVTTANNGLTMNGTTTQLGGALIKATSITGTDRLTLATPTTISGILQITSGSPDTGKVLTSDINGTATWVTPGISTANNGITMNGSVAQLGGALNQNTTITGATRLTIATATTISGTALLITSPLQIASGTPGAGKVLMSDFTGNATWATAINTANNGLTMNGIAAQLGGDLTQPTSITGTNRLTLATPLQISSGTPGAGKVLTSDASGNATWAANATPWYKVGTTVPSILNTDDSYLTAKTVIGGNTIASINGGTANAQLTVIGQDASINGITVGKGRGAVASNTAVGANSLEANTSGSNNTAIGSGALKSNQTSSLNTAVGYQVLQANTTGGANTAMGYSAGSGLTTGNGNTAMGYSAGANLTTGGYNVAIGYNVSLPDPAGNFQINIGNAIFGVTSLTAGAGRVSIGKTTPDAGVFLDVAGLTQITGAGKFKYVDSNQLSGRVLSTDNNGVAKWADQNMLTGSWFYIPSINLDMSTLTVKTVDLFKNSIMQLTSLPLAGSSGAIQPTLPTTATAYDYMYIGSSGHITNVSINTSGVMTYTPTTTNPPPFAFVNIIVRVK